MKIPQNKIVRTSYSLGVKEFINQKMKENQKSRNVLASFYFFGHFELLFHRVQRDTM